METKHKYMQAGIWYTIGNYLVYGLAFLSIPIFSRMMSANDYGVYNTFMAYESILFVIIGFALHSSFKNAKYRYNEQFDTYVSCSYLFSLVSLAFFLCASFFLYIPLGRILELSRLELLLLVVYSFGSAIIQYYSSYLSLKYEYKSYITVSVINMVMNVTLSVVFMVTVLSDNRSLGRIIGSTIPLILISTVIILKQFKKAHPSGIREKWTFGLKYSLPIIPHGVSQVILTQFDRIMINKMVGSSEAGIYSFAYNLYTIVMITSTSIDNVWSTWFYEKISSKDYIKIKERSTQMFYIMALFCAGIMLMSPEIIKVLAPSTYYDSVYSAIPVVCAAFFAFLYYFPSGVEYYLGKTYLIAVGTCGAAAVNIILNYIFIRKYGYVAAAYTTLTTYMLYFIFHYIISRKIYKERLFSVKSILGSSLIVLVSMLISRTLLDILGIRILIVAVAGFFLIVIIRNMKKNNILNDNT